MAPVETMIRLAGLVAAGLFAGSGLMETFVQQPARNAASPKVALEQMQHVLARADPYMPLLAVGALLAAIVSAMMKFAVLPLVAASFFGAIFILSGVAIKPLNKRIRAYALEQADPATAAVMVRGWGRLHAVRAGAGVLGFVTLILSFSLTGAPA